LVTRFNRDDEKHGGVSILTQDFVETALTASTLTSVISVAANERLVLTKATVFVPSGSTPDPATAEVQDGNGDVVAKSTNFSAGETHELYANPDGTPVLAGELQVNSDNGSAEFTVAGRVQQTFTV